MSSPPRNLPRFLPTLTEVVHPSSLVKSTPPETPDLEAIVQSVMHRVDLVLERRLSEEVDALVRTHMEDQMKAVHLRLLNELASVVQQAVTDALIVQTDALK